MPIRVLEICGKLNIGGAQRVAANIGMYAPADCEVTYLVYGDTVGEYEAALTDRGCRILHVPSPREVGRGYVKKLAALIREGGYDVVHCHTMFSSGLVMLAARLGGAKGRICHSHTAKDNSRLTVKRRAYRWFSRLLIRRFGTEFLACGGDAGAELYGKRWFQKHGQILRNGIDIERFRYDAQKAAQAAEAYGLEGRFVIGHVGHYVDVKNQAFLIRLMPELAAKRPEALLLMFGAGEDRPKLEALIQETGMEAHARLMGNVPDVSEVLSAFDVFAFPSLFEGTPLALIEAQTNGLPCIISDRIPQDACLTDLIRRLPLDRPEEWIDAILSAKRRDPAAWSKEVAKNYETVSRSMETLYEIFFKYQARGEGHA
jgi:glycosyltransferase EpsF